MFKSNCKQCDKILEAKYFSKIKKFCSKSCVGIYTIKNNPKAFKIGYTSWNKGMKGYRSGKGTRPDIMPRGEKHWSWKGGISKDVHSTAEPKYKEWRTEVFIRDGWKCKINNKDCKGPLQVHHILPWRDYIELRYVVNNGIALCQAHHPRKRAEEKRLSPYFTELVSVSKDPN